MKTGRIKQEWEHSESVQDGMTLLTLLHSLAMQELSS
jgi:hypothetical protein